MKTIAITIDEDILARVDRLAGRGGANKRSHLIRRAVHEYVSRVEQADAHEREDAIIRRHRGRLAQQTKALVREQAKP